MSEDNSQEKTEQPTAKRLDDSREKGQVARSRELTTVAMLLAGALGAYLMGGRVVTGLYDSMRSGLMVPREMLEEEWLMPIIFAEAAVAGFELVAPLLLVLVVVAMFAPLALGGFSFSPQAVLPKFDKLNPVKGFSRIFSLKGLIEMLKALAKFLLIASIAVSLLWHLSAEFIGLAQESLESAFVHVGDIVKWAFLLCSSSLLIVAAIDVPFQLWDHNRQLKMTLQEVRDESKETDGRPEVKARIRNMQRELAQGRMMEEVPRADVVVTNPTHFAVALKYDPDANGAPRVVAKGSDLIAAQIRSIAIGADIPLFQAPPLARAIYYSTDIDREIPAGLYLAVAQVLAYIFQLRDVKQQGGASPTPPEDLPIPEEFLKPGHTAH